MEVYLFHFSLFGSFCGVRCPVGAGHDGCVGSQEEVGAGHDGGVGSQEGVGAGFDDCRG